MFNWVVDGLPAARTSQDPNNGEEFFSIGFELGFMRDQAAYLNNVYDIQIQIHEHEKKYRIIGVLIWPNRFDLES
jgi:hypothetical protein